VNADSVAKQEDAIFAKAAWRLIPFLGLLYVVNFLDRVNIGFAALTMNKDIGLGAEAYGWGAGIFFIGYFLFEVPSNVILERVGARLWIFRIMLSWGIVSAATAFVHGATSFYVLRFLLGVMEAGFFPGIMLYLTYWFPASSRARFNSYFFFAIPLASAIGGPLSSGILQMGGIAHLHGWQWLFLIEGLPAGVLAFLVLAYLPDGPGRAKWLNDDEKRLVAARLARDAILPTDLWSGLSDLRVWWIAAADFGIVFALYGIGFWLPQIVKAMGFSNLETGFVVACPYIICAFAMVAWARSSDVRGERVWHVVIAALLGAGGLAAAAMLHASMFSLIALTVAAVGIYAALVSIWTLPSSILGGTAAAGGIALINSLANLGGFIGPFVMGWLKQSTGGYETGMAVLAAGLLTSVVLVLALARTLLVPSPAAALD
jgi:ACS family tartrate transporter-like MFS transporter